MDYSIGEFSNVVNLSIYTLRYYEQEKLIAPARKGNDQRCYSENDVIWIQFIKRLKDTGMPIKEIRRYAELRAEGDTTMLQRMEMLTEHKMDIEGKIRKLQEHLENLDSKIGYYKTKIDKQ